MCMSQSQLRLVSRLLELLGHSEVPAVVPGRALGPRCKANPGTRLGQKGGVSCVGRAQ